MLNDAHVNNIITPLLVTPAPQTRAENSPNDDLIDIDMITIDIDLANECIGDENLEYGEINLEKIYNESE